MTAVVCPRNQTYKTYQTLGRWYHYTTCHLRVYINATSTPQPNFDIRQHPATLAFIRRHRDHSVGPFAISEDGCSATIRVNTINIDLVRSNHPVNVDGA